MQRSDTGPERPPPAPSLTRARVTQRPGGRTVVFVAERRAWPYEQFADYLRALMNAAGIPDYAELSRRSGVSQTQLSNWRRGLAQPSRDNLNRIASHVDATPVQLWIAAGLVEPRQLNMDGAPDLTVLPAELRDLLDLYGSPELTEEERALIRSQARTATLGVRAIVAERLRSTPARKGRGRAS